MRVLVEKSVDYFRESGQGTQNFPLAKNCSLLIYGITTYLSINNALHRVQRTSAQAFWRTCRGYPQIQINIL
jgi:hypothetical protein